MIKNINRKNILTTPFVAMKGWELTNVDSQEVVLTELTGSEEPVALEFMDYTTGMPFVNRECNIALEQQSSDLAIPEAGVKGTGTFFPDREETNQKTNTFKRLVHTQTERAFYNDYRNPLKIFGIDNIDFPLSKIDRFISNEFLMFTIPRNVFGDRLTENTIRMYDTTFDDNLIITDDGDGNLIAGTRLFSRVQEVRPFGNSISTGSIVFCADAIWEEDFNLWDLEPLFWDGCVTSSTPPTPTSSVSASAAAWWPFEDEIEGPWSDVYNGDPILQFIPDVSSVTGTQLTVAGKVGNALRITGENDGSSTNVNVRSSSVDLVYNGGLTYTTWLRIVDKAPSAIGIFYRGYNGFGPPFGGSVKEIVSMTPFWLSSSKEWSITLTSASFDDVLDLTVPFDPILGQWYLLRFSYDAISGSLIYQVDNGPEQVSTGSFSFTPPNFVSARLQLRVDSVVGGCKVDFDEVNFFSSSLSVDQATSIWNSGTGSTVENEPGCMTFLSSFRITGSTPTTWMQRAYPKYVAASTDRNIDTMVISDNESSASIEHNRHNWFFSSHGTFLNDYTSSYVHTWSRRNAVFANGKYYMLNDGLKFRVADAAITASSMLVFDKSGSLLSTVALTHGGVDWDTDGERVWVFEHNGTGAFLQTITASNDTTSSVSNILDTMSQPVTMSATAFNPISQDAGYYQGRMLAFKDNAGISHVVVNDLAPSGIETGSGDHLWMITSNQITNDIELGPDNPLYQGWMGSLTYCPLTDTIFVGVYANSADFEPLILELDLTLNVINTYNLLSYIATDFLVIDSIAYNAKNKTIEFFSAYQLTGGGQFLVLDPIAQTVLCQVFPADTAANIHGQNIAVNAANGNLYVPQRLDVTPSGVTGSVKIYRV